MKIITVQHTQAVHHVNGMCGGSTDWPLTAKGKRQARRVARRLRRELGQRPDYVLYASDMLRTRQTAEAIARALRLEIHWEPRMREIGIGEGKGQSKAWLNANKAPPAPGVMWMDCRPVAGAETWRELQARVAPFVEELAQAHENAIVVGHGNSLRAFLFRWLRMPEDAPETVGLGHLPGGVTYLHDEFKRFGASARSIDKLNS